MKADIVRQFEKNVKRVESLITMYGQSSPSAGRADVTTSDLLRAAVVFLHATLEELIRNLHEWKLPLAAPKYLEDVPLVGHKPRQRFTLDHLAKHRGKTVDQLIEESVNAALLDSNYNHPGELDKALEKVGLPKSLLDPYRDKAGSLMKRRHWIVHRADKNPATGSGHHSARSLQQSAVQTWLEAVRQFGADVLSKV